MAAPTPGKSRKIQIQISDTLDHQLTRAAKSYGITKSAFVRVALERDLAFERKLARECARNLDLPENELGVNKNQLGLFKV
jgi:hypothetical protein